MIEAPDLSEYDGFRASVRAFADREIAPHSKAWDEQDALPWEAITSMAKAGLTGVIAPQALGGQARDYISLGIVIEELARADVSCAIICWLQATIGTLIPGWGDDTLRAVHAGQALLCLATSEEDAGSEVSNIQTRARREGADYVITGEKIHVSLMPGADVMGVTAKVETGEGRPRITMFRVPADAPGVSSTPMEQMGARAHQLGRVTLDDVRVPVDAVLGEGGAGKQVLNARFNVSRCLSPLAAVGAAQATIERTIDFVKAKKVFKRPIGTNQSISFALVEHHTRLEMAKLMAYTALRQNALGRNAVREAAMAKWFGITNAIAAVSDCLGMHGANGYLKEWPLEQRLRDVMALQFTGGTINVMKILLVRELLGREFTGIE